MSAGSAYAKDGENERKALRTQVESAKSAAAVLARTPTVQKNAALLAMAASLRESADEISLANAADMDEAQKAGRSSAFLDRLSLPVPSVEAMAGTVEEVATLSDPIGDVTESWRRPNGLRIEKVRIPLGLVLMIYEARPNVTSDAGALCLKSGNAVLLRGGSDAARTNLAITSALHRGLEETKLPVDAISYVARPEREALMELLQMEGLIDLCIPRGGEGLIRAVAENARIPVVKHYKGVCHVYVEESADLAMAEAIVLNAKAQRPGVCNAAECLLVDREISERFLPRVGKALTDVGVELRACPSSLPILQHAGVSAFPAQPDDYGREFLELILAVRVVRDLDHALEHIQRYGSEHTEAIVTQRLFASERFTREVMASAVVVNASTRFNDGGELGLGAEIGISTSRLHAFGPMGLKELTAQKYVVHGEGQVRQSPKVG